MVRRLIVALAVVAVMTGAFAGAPSVMVGGIIDPAPKTAIAQPGAPEFCGPWRQSWFVSTGGWWYYWWWRFCFNPSLPPSQTIGGGWFIDWAGWDWFGPAPPYLSPGFQYSGGPPS